MKFKKFLAVLLAATMIFSMSAVGLTASAASVHSQSATAAVQDIELKSDFELMFSKMFRQMFNGILEMFKLYNAMSVTDVSIEQNSYAVAVGEKITIKAKTLPSRAKNNVIHWMSEDSSVASVGNSGVVVGKSVGKTTIYAVADDGGFYNKCTVKVTAKESNACTSIFIEGESKYKVLVGSESFTTGVITTTPSIDKIESNIEVSSSDTRVATATLTNDYKLNIVPGNTVGKAKITVSCDGVTDAIEVHTICETINVPIVIADTCDYVSDCPNPQTRTDYCSGRQLQKVTTTEYCTTASVSSSTIATWAGVDSADITETDAANYFKTKYGCTHVTGGGMWKYSCKGYSVSEEKLVGSCTNYDTSTGKCLGHTTKYCPGHETTKEAMGKCGDSVYWNYDASTSTLDIFGGGSMYSFLSDAYLPWNEYSDEVEFVNISKKVSYLWSFNSCENLTKITVEEGNSFYSTDDYGVLYNENKTELIECPRNADLSGYCIPTTVEKICKYAFRFNKNKVAICIPSNVKTIESFAFAYSDFTQIIVSPGVGEIKSCAFEFCDELEKIAIPNTTTFSVGIGGIFGLGYLDPPDFYYNGTYSDFSREHIGALRVPDVYCGAVLVNVYYSEDVAAEKGEEKRTVTLYFEEGTVVNGNMIEEALSETYGIESIADDINVTVIAGEVYTANAYD